MFLVASHVHIKQMIAQASTIPEMMIVDAKFG
jgi:hypothetical protein